MTTSTAADLISRSPGPPARVGRPPADQLVDGRPVLPPWAAECASGLNAETLTAEVVEACLGVAFPQHRSDPEFVGSLRASIAQNVHAVQRLLCSADDLVNVPRDRVRAFAGIQARLAIPQTSLQRSYRVSFFTIWRAWVDRLIDCAHTLGVDRDEAGIVLRDLSTLVLAYQDRVASEVAEIYARDHELLLQSRAFIRQRIVRELLGDHQLALPASDAAILGYDLGASHIAVLLSSTTEPAVSRLAERLAAAVPVSQTLTYPLSVHAFVVWVGTSRTGIGSTPLRNVLELAQAAASCSSPHVGAAGFREAFDQVRLVDRVRTSLGRERSPRIMEYQDVALEILLLQNLPMAQDFLQAELGELMADNRDAERLRQTLAFSLEFNSHVATAQQLGVHEHTVRNRLQRIETMLGRPWHSRRTEVQVALRLHRLLENEDREPGGSVGG